MVEGQVTLTPIWIDYSDDTPRPKYHITEGVGARGWIGSKITPLVPLVFSD